MREGWCNKDYWALCEDQREAEHLTAIYGLAEYLPGYFIVGLKSWDEFILADCEGQYFLVPTVPLERAGVASFRFPAESLRLELSPCRTKPASCGHFKTGQSEVGDS